jgi:DNA-binding NarL/FixJ family response regulator
MTAIRLFIVDDQASIRDALAVMLGLDPDLDVVGVAGDGREALDRIPDAAPDVVLMDLNMPVMGGAEATGRLRTLRPDLAVVVLTTFEDDASILAALTAGARGYLTKDADRATIVQAVRGAYAGTAILDPRVQRRLLDLAARGTAPEPAAATGLTAREREILGLIGQGLRNSEIARALYITEATVKTHINNLFTKADLHSRADAVRLALTLHPRPGGR